MQTIAHQVRSGISSIEPYLPGLTDDELKQMFGLRQVIKLNANENALGPSPMAIAAMQEELSTLHHYPDGSSELLRKAIAAFHQVSAEQVLVGNGSDDLIKLLSETFLEDGDEVVMLKPSFSQYGFGAAIMRAKVVQVPLNDDFSYNVEALAAAVTPRTKLVYACSPNNPTGTILTQQEAGWLLSNLPEHVVLVLDLAYNDYSTRADRVVETETLLRDPRVVCLHTFSKLYGLAGLRVGYGLASADLWNYVNRVREPFNVNRLAQRAATAALQDEAHRVASRKLAQESTGFYLDLCQAYGLQTVRPEGNFVLIRVGDGKGALESLMSQGVMVRYGFGLPEHLRITFGTAGENEALKAALGKFLGVR